MPSCSGSAACVVARQACWCGNSSGAACCRRFASAACFSPSPGPACGSGCRHLARFVGVVLFALAVLVALWPLRRLRRPAEAESFARIDSVSGVPHRPAATLVDTLANPGADPATAALWALHRRRAEAEAQRLRTGFPAPRLQERDRYALRGGIVVALVAMAIVAGPERYARVAAAFDWRGATAGPGAARLDAWLDPPPYTGRAPLILNVAAGTQPQRIEAPVGSLLIVRASAGGITLEGGDGLKEPEVPADAKPATPPKPDGAEARRILRADTHLTLRAAGGGGVFDLVAIPDKPPVIALTAAPRVNLRGTFPPRLSGRRRLRRHLRRGDVCRAGRRRPPALAAFARRSAESAARAARRAPATSGRPKRSPICQSIPGPARG